MASLFLYFVSIVFFIGGQQVRFQEDVLAGWILSIIGAVLFYAGVSAG